MQICESKGEIVSKLGSSIRLMMKWPIWSCALHDKRLKGPVYSIWWCPKPQKGPKKCQKWLLTLNNLNFKYTLKYTYTYRLIDKQAKSYCVPKNPPTLNPSFPPTIWCAIDSWCCADAEYRSFMSARHLGAKLWRFNFFDFCHPGLHFHMSGVPGCTSVRLCQTRQCFSLNP
jgi:hypothetical protein